MGVLLTPPLGQLSAFFMRKGADCLSKWVGEAERQLRLLFEEAKACQPSIIFFDEIDGKSKLLRLAREFFVLTSSPPPQDLRLYAAPSRTRSTPRLCRLCSP